MLPAILSDRGFALCRLIGLLDEVAIIAQDFVIVGHVLNPLQLCCPKIRVADWLYGNCTDREK